MSYKSNSFVLCYKKQTPQQPELNFPSISAGSSTQLVKVDILYLYFIFHVFRFRVCRAVSKAWVGVGWGFQGALMKAWVYGCVFGVWGPGDEKRRLGSDSIATQMDLANRTSL